MLHSPNLNCRSIVRFGACENLLRPRRIGVAVKDDQMAIVRCGAIHIVPCLLDACFNGFVELAVVNLEFDDCFLNLLLDLIVAMGPNHQQIGASMAQPIFAPDLATAVNNTLKVSLHQKLGAGFFVLKALDPMLRMFAEECLEIMQEFVHVQAAIIHNEPCCIACDGHLGRVSQFTGDHFLIDWIGDLEIAGGANQPQIAYILYIIGPQCFGMVVTGQDRFDHQPLGTLPQLEAAG